MPGTAGEEANERLPFSAAVIVVHFHPLQEHQAAEHDGIAKWRRFRRFQSAIKIRGGLPDLLHKMSRERIHWLRLVNEAATQRPIGLDQCLQALADIEINHFWLFATGTSKAEGQDHQQPFVGGQKLIGNPDVFVRVIRGQGGGLLMNARLAQILTIEGTAYGDLAPGAAAQSADVALNTGTVAARTPCLANLAEDHGNTLIVT